jgi:NAD(P)-dependent dehydrogenase (short-subunit alcohol dehydrogenase family)
LTKSLALEFAPHGIRVNAIGAGAIETPTLCTGRPQDEGQRFKALRAAEVPLGRLGQPEDVAAVLDFLFSERSAYLTGQIIHVNGGELIW